MCRIMWTCTFTYARRHFFAWHDPYIFFIWSGARYTKTCLYNVDSLKPRFYTVKLRLTGVYVFFSYFCSWKNIDCGYSLEPPRRGGYNEQLQSMFWAEIWKYQNFHLKIFIFLVVKFSVHLIGHVFVMNIQISLRLRAGWSVFTVRLNMFWIFGYLQKCTVKIPIRLSGCACWSETSLCAHVVLKLK